MIYAYGQLVWAPKCHRDFPHAEELTLEVSCGMCRMRGHHAPTTLHELQAFARVRGKDAGAARLLPR